MTDAFDTVRRVRWIISARHQLRTQQVRNSALDRKYLKELLRLRKQLIGIKQQLTDRIGD